MNLINVELENQASQDYFYTKKSSFQYNYSVKTGKI